MVYYDNVSAVYISDNPAHHRRAKHIELDIHYVHEQVALGRVCIQHIHTAQKLADVMTKGLLTSTLEEIQYSLCVEVGPVP